MIEDIKFLMKLIKNKRAKISWINNATSSPDENIYRKLTSNCE